MLEALQLQKLAREIVGKRMPGVQLDDVVAVPFTDGEGESALRITLVISPETVDAITGKDALKLLVDIKDALFREGEERFAFLEYTTADDVPTDEDED